MLWKVMLWNAAEYLVVTSRCLTTTHRSTAHQNPYSPKLQRPAFIHVMREGRSKFVLFVGELTVTSLRAAPTRIDLVQVLNLRKQLILCFYYFRIGQTTVYRTYGGALRLVVKAHALGAFIRHDIVVGVGPKFTRESSRRGRIAVLFTGQSPCRACFVNSRVRALGLARSAVDTIRCNVDSHSPRRKCRKNRVQIYERRRMCCLSSADQVHRQQL
jgi:hypothetical protein